MNQQWQLVPTDSGYYQIVSRQSGMVLDVISSGPDGGMAAGTKVQQYNWEGGLNQQWQFVPTDSGYYQIVNRQSGLVLDVINSNPDGGMAAGTKVQQYNWEGGLNQQWHSY